jgi:hypothetical protein
MAKRKTQKKAKNRPVQPSTSDWLPWEGRLDYPERLILLANIGCDLGVAEKVLGVSPDDELAGLYESLRDGECTGDVCARVMVKLGVEPGKWEFIGDCGGKIQCEGWSAESESS